jgi:hypothetical protein
MVVRLALIALGVVAVVAVAPVVSKKDTLDHVRDAMPSDCASISTNPQGGYPGAEKSVYLRCEAMGPVLGYVRYSRPASARAAARNSTESLGRPFRCVKGRELVTSSSADFEANGFAALCADIDGRLVRR